MQRLWGCSTTDIPIACYLLLMGAGVVRLEPCSGCSRHVRVSERTCVFCGSALDFSAAPLPLLPKERLSRGELMSFRALVRTGVVAAAASGFFPACDDDASTVAVYGAPCSPPECGVTGGTSGSTETGGTSGTASSGGEAGLGGEGGE